MISRNLSVIVVAALLVLPHYSQPGVFCFHCRTQQPCEGEGKTGVITTMNGRGEQGLWEAELHKVTEAERREAGLETRPAMCLSLHHTLPYDAVRPPGPSPFSARGKERPT